MTLWIHDNFTSFQTFRSSLSFYDNLWSQFYLFSEQGNVDETIIFTMYWCKYGYTLYIYIENDPANFRNEWLNRYSTPSVTRSSAQKPLLSCDLCLGSPVDINYTALKQECAVSFQDGMVSVFAKNFFFMFYHSIENLETAIMTQNKKIEGIIF